MDRWPCREDAVCRRNVWFGLTLHADTIATDEWSALARSRIPETALV